jgi:transcriptional regulator with XRE-family HTH domain
LRELRGDKSLRDVERSHGISHTYLSSLEKGADPRTGKARNPSPETLKILSEAYNFPYEELLNKAGYLDFYTRYTNLEKLQTYKGNENGQKALSRILNNISENGLFIEELKDDLSSIEENARLSFGSEFNLTPANLLKLVKCTDWDEDEHEINIIERLGIAEVLYLLDELSNRYSEDNSKKSASSIFDDYITEFTHLLLDDKEHPFANEIDTEFQQRISKIYKKYNLTSKRISIRIPGTTHADIIKQKLEALLDHDDSNFKFAVLRELQSIAHKYHLWFNPASEYGSTEFSPIELEEVINNEPVTYKGNSLDEKHIKLITAYLDALFPDRQ